MDPNLDHEYSSDVLPALQLCGTDMKLTVQFVLGVALLGLALYGGLLLFDHYEMRPGRGVIAKCEGGTKEAAGGVHVYDASEKGGEAFSFRYNEGYFVDPVALCDAIVFAASGSLGGHKLKTLRRDPTTVEIYGTQVRVLVPQGVRIRLSRL
jgi:hypothetical protein